MPEVYYNFDYDPEIFDLRIPFGKSTKIVDFYGGKYSVKVWLGSYDTDIDTAPQIIINTDLDFENNEQFKNKLYRRLCEKFYFTCKKQYYNLINEFDWNREGKMLWERIVCMETYDEYKSKIYPHNMEGKEVADNLRDELFHKVNGYDFIVYKILNLDEK